MKHRIQHLLLLLLPALLPAASAWAESIPADKAKAAAGRFLQQVDPSRRPQLSLVQLSPNPDTKTSSAAPAYYIFNDAKGGFVIAGGDDSVPSVLGYSTTGRIQPSSMPDNMRGWMDMWQRIVTGNRASGAPAYQEPPRTKAGTEKILPTANWDQGDPYNQLCPEFDGKRTLTGCSATSTAIVMRYHKYPAAGTGKLDKYTFEDDNGTTRSVDGVTLGHSYNWDKMPLDKPSLSAPWTDEQKTQVATLMRDLGVMLQAQYGADGTSAYAEDIVPGLTTYFGYDKGAALEYMRFYDDAAAWTARIKKNIDEVGPAVYSGYSDKSGHAFVVDGYDSQGNLHVNWGWSGDQNGFFAVPRFLTYTQSHNACLGLKPEAGGKAPYLLLIAQYKDASNNIDGHGLALESGTPATGSPFTISCIGIFNYGEGLFSGQIAVGKFDRNNNLEEIISEPDPCEFSHYNGQLYFGIPCTITTAVHAGDYLTMVFTTAAAPALKDWTPASYDHESDNVVGRLLLGDSVILEKIVSLQYDIETATLSVIFSDSCTRVLKNASGSIVTTGVVDSADKLTVDAKQLTKGTYTLHLERGDQSKDIQIVFGLK